MSDLPEPLVPSWLDIETEPKDGAAVLIYAAANHGLEAFKCVVRYHSDAGWCVDELREATHWMPLPDDPG